MGEIKWGWAATFFGLGWGSASILEIFWTCAALVGILVTIWLGIQAILDLLALKEQDDYVPYGPRHIIARQTIRNTFDRLFLFVIFLVVGLVALQTPPARPNHPPTVYAIVLGLGLVIAELGMMIDSLFDRHDRIELNAVMRNRVSKRRRYTGEGAL